MSVWHFINVAFLECQRGFQRVLESFRKGFGESFRESLQESLQETLQKTLRLSFIRDLERSLEREREREFEGDLGRGLEIAQERNGIQRADIWRRRGGAMPCRGLSISTSFTSINVKLRKRSRFDLILTVT